MLQVQQTLEVDEYKALVGSSQRLSKTSSFTNNTKKSYIPRYLAMMTVLLFVPHYLKLVYGIVGGEIDDGNHRVVDLSDFTIVSGPKDRPAIVMLSDNSPKVSKFQTESIEEKAAYAQYHNYTLVCLTSLLDEYRSATWSKLKLVYKVLNETPHHTILWLDVDTIIWNRKVKIEDLSLPSISISAQLDLHRSIESKYFNAGIFVIHKTDWIMNILRDAYRQWQIVLFQGLFYFDADQDALNLVMGKSGQELDKHLDLKRYGELWTLSKDLQHSNPYVLHFPNCLEGRCAPEYLELFRQTINKEYL